MGEEFEGGEEEYADYLAEVPSDEDERKLVEEYMAPGVEWIQYREWKVTLLSRRWLICKLMLF